MLLPVPSPKFFSIPRFSSQLSSIQEIYFLSFALENTRKIENYFIPTYPTKVCRTVSNTLFFQYSSRLNPYKKIRRERTLLIIVVIIYEMTVTINTYISRWRKKGISSGWIKSNQDRIAQPVQISIRPTTTDISSSLLCQLETMSHIDFCGVNQPTRTKKTWWWSSSSWSSGWMPGTIESGLVLLRIF